MIDSRIRPIPRFYYIPRFSDDDFYILLYGLLIGFFIVLCFMIWIGYFDKD